MVAKTKTSTSFGVIPDWQLPAGIQACVTTVTEPGNLAAHVGDDPATVLRHRRVLQRQLALPSYPKWLTQIHSTQVVEYANADVGAVADAIWAQTDEAVCAVLTADCLPILLASNDGEVIAAIHAGWRGLVAGVVEQTIGVLPRSPDELMAYIGPAISQDYFQVGADVYAAFAEKELADTATFRAQYPGKWLANLPLLAQKVLQRCGLANITQSGLCTYSDPRFSSYRASPHAGRIASLIWKS